MRLLMRVVMWSKFGFKFKNIKILGDQRFKINFFSFNASSVLFNLSFDMRLTRIEFLAIIKTFKT